MKTALFLALLFCTLLNGCSRQHSITGEIFIITAGHESVKLGLVRIAVLDLDETIRSIAAVETKVAAQRPAAAEISRVATKLSKKAFDLELAAAGQNRPDIQQLSEDFTMLDARANWRVRYYDSVAPFVSELPEAITETKTDSDGRFRVVVPSGHEIALLAATTRHVGDSSECYAWIIRVPPKTEHITLSNDNLVTSDSSQSLVQTTEDCGEDIPESREEVLSPQLASLKERAGSVVESILGSK